MGPLHPVYFSFFSLMGPGANCFIKHTGVLFYHSPAPPSPPTYVCANIFFLHTKWNTEANIKIKKKKKRKSEIQSIMFLWFFGQSIQNHFRNVLRFFFFGQSIWIYRPCNSNDNAMIYKKGLRSFYFRVWPCFYYI